MIKDKKNNVNHRDVLLQGGFRWALIVSGQKRQGEMVRRRNCQLGHKMRSSKTARSLRLRAQVRAMDPRRNGQVLRWQVERVIDRISRES